MGFSLCRFSCEPEESNPGGEADFLTMLKSSDLREENYDLLIIPYCCDTCGVAIQQSIRVCGFN
jgi:hypothetical protein